MMGGWIPCILISTSYVLLTMFLAELARKIVAASMPDSLIRRAILEFVAAAEMCGCAFELIISKLIFNI